MRDANCEHDCNHHCIGCYRTFCDIKEEEGLTHENELPEAVYTDSGNSYCHRDCFRDSQG